MGKRKRKSNQKKEPSSPTLAVSLNPTPQDDLKSNKRALILPTQMGILTSHSQQGQANSRVDICPPQVNGKLWNRFYEPLVLLLAYGKSQGKHVKFNDVSSEQGVGNTNDVLYKGFLDELAYVCDCSTSGDTVVNGAIFFSAFNEYIIASYNHFNYFNKIRSGMGMTLKLVSAHSASIWDQGRIISYRRMCQVEGAHQNWSTITNLVKSQSIHRSDNESSGLAQ